MVHDRNSDLHKVVEFKSAVVMIVSNGPNYLKQDLVQNRRRLHNTVPTPNSVCLVVVVLFCRLTMQSSYQAGAYILLQQISLCLRIVKNSILSRERIEIMLMNIGGLLCHT